MNPTTSTSENRFLYPIALNIYQRNCVVVGGGLVGARKAKALAEAGAFVRIVSPSLCSEAELLVAEGKARWIAEPFLPAHLENTYLVIAATDNPTVNAQIGQLAAAKNRLFNKAAPDGMDNETGDFVTMATVRRGDLRIGITCGGAGPALSAKLRRELAEQFGLEWEPVVALLGELRTLAKQTIPDSTERTNALRRLANQAERLAELFAKGEAQTARKEAESCLHL